MSMQIDEALPQAGDWRFDDCPLSCATEVIGSRASLLVVREAFYGTTRFSDFVTNTGLTDAVVSTRLRTLSTVGVFSKRAYREPKRRERFEYVLTPMGSELLPVVVSLLQWGGKHLQHGRGPVQIVAEDSRRPVRVEIIAPDGDRERQDDLLVLARTRPA